MKKLLILITVLILGQATQAQYHYKTSSNLPSIAVLLGTHVAHFFTFKKRDIDGSTFYFQQEKTNHKFKDTIALKRVSSDRFKLGAYLVKTHLNKLSFTAGVSFQNYTIQPPETEEVTAVYLTPVLGLNYQIRLPSQTIGSYGIIGVGMDYHFQSGKGHNYEFQQNENKLAFTLSNPKTVLDITVNLGVEAPSWGQIGLGANFNVLDPIKGSSQRNGQDIKDAAFSGTGPIFHLFTRIPLGF